jgi:hypothetical protein
MTANRATIPAEAKTAMPVPEQEFDITLFVNGLPEGCRSMLERPCSMRCVIDFISPAAH